MSSSPFRFGCIWSILTKYGGGTARNERLLLNTRPPQKSTLLVKILSKDPKIENLSVIYLPIYKKIFILVSVSQIFTNKVDFSSKVNLEYGKSNLFIKICETDPKMKIFLYIGKWITGKFWISESSDKIFTNKVDFWRCGFVSKKSTILIW